MAATDQGGHRAGLRKQLATLAQGTFVALLAGSFLLAFGGLRLADSILPARSEGAMIGSLRQSTESRRIEDADGRRRTEQVRVYEVRGTTEGGELFEFDDQGLYEQVDEAMVVTAHRSRLTGEVRGLHAEGLDWSVLGARYWLATFAAMVFGGAFVLSGVLGVRRLPAARREAQEAGVVLDGWAQPRTPIVGAVLGSVGGALAVWLLGLHPI